MKKQLLLIFILLRGLSSDVQAQCTDLFISEYSHGKYNNRAMEIYNPTNAAISLSGYKMARNSNGGSSWTTTNFAANAVVQPYKTYVVICDKRDTTQYKVNLEYPIFDGYEKWDSCRDAAGKPTKYADGTFIFCIQVDTLNGNLPVRGRVYNDFVNLQCRATAYLDPVYNTNNTFYFSGNDAMGLFKGTPDLVNFTNLVDMFGVYNDPGMVVTANSWKNTAGLSVSDNVTMVRKREIKKGTGIVAYVRQDTFRYGDWLRFANSNSSPSFQNLGSHTCDCDPAPPVSARRTCQGVVIVGNQEVPVSKLSIYPNPSVSGNVTLEAEGKIKEVRVYNMMGQVIDSQQMPLLSETVQLNLNVKTAGVYIVQIKTEDNRMGVQRLVIH